MCLMCCLDQQRIKSYPSLLKWSTEMAYLVSSVRGTGNAIFVQNTMGKASYCKYQHVVNINILYSAILLVEVNTDS